jgi:hypothetical protein
MNRKFGRIYKQDERDKLFLMQPNMELAAERTSRHWWMGDILDQRDTPMCVGYAGYKYLQAGPVRNVVPFTPADVYYGAQKNDEIPGENYDGSTIRGCFKWLDKQGYIAEYRWAWNINTIIAQLLAHGPVVVGTNWYEGMMQTTKIGIVKPTGYVLGGHAYVLSGINKTKEKFRIVNSWGRYWGEKGRAWIRFGDFQELLNEGGEACIAVEIKK